MKMPSMLLDQLRIKGQGVPGSGWTLDNSAIAIYRLMLAVEELEREVAALKKQTH